MVYLVVRTMSQRVLTLLPGQHRAVFGVGVPAVYAPAPLELADLHALLM